MNSCKSYNNLRCNVSYNLFWKYTAYYFLHPFTAPALFSSQRQCYVFWCTQHGETSLVAQLVKNPPAMQETMAQFMGWEDPLEKGKATHSNILTWRIPWTV